MKDSDYKVKEFIKNNDLPIDDHFGVVSNGKPEYFEAFLKIIMGANKND